MQIAPTALRRVTVAATAIAALPALAFGGWVAASLRLTLNAMQGAALSGDAQGFSDHVDYPALRQSLKAELRANIDAEAAATPETSLKALGLAMARNFVDPLVENSVSPEAVGLLFTAMGDGGVLAGSPVMESLALLAAPDLDIRREGFSSFQVALEGNEAAPRLLFRRDGWRWRLSGVDLDPARLPAPAA
ncbi:DUF2939 domain-containing protein [Sandaracinobacter neustonicus]|uniref:DUF2939 domain-containing protein n=1 Tax=Sandaracinobacter neustonicus TaxID=1715348 RepID=A0A501XKW8_9SPHN|nr:DUF2939 domain-containing protein [Sandaracinobacter neustonicus]TPE61095.1 DUF2939 domain-containing protein [Sandaracinobacter neustonicus]